MAIYHGALIRAMDDKSPEEYWHECPRGTWLLLIAQHLGINGDFPEMLSVLLQLPDEDFTGIADIDATLMCCERLRHLVFKHAWSGAAAQGLGTQYRRNAAYEACDREHQRQAEIIRRHIQVDVPERGQLALFAWA